MSDYTEKTNFIDLPAQQRGIRNLIDSAIARVLDHGQYVMGPEVALFEQELKSFSNVKYALSCANGTDAISLVLMSWDVGKNDAVFVPAFTYVASAECPAQLGATPFFIDVKENTFNLDIESFKQAIFDSKKLGLKPKAVIAVDLFGEPCEIEEISDVAKENNIKVLVDAAQSFGSSRNGVMTGNFGDATTTSFFPAKPLGCYGDGGAVLTNDDELSNCIDSIRLHGRGIQKYDHIRVGLNSRLDTIQAAILIEKLKIFPKELIQRDKIASKYSQLLSDFCKTPENSNDNFSAWAQFTLRLENRDEIQKKLKQNDIPSVIYYPKSLDNQDGYKNYPIVTSGLKVSNALTSKVLSLPMHPYLTEKDINKIVNIITN